MASYKYLAVNLEIFHRLESNPNTHKNSAKSLQGKYCNVCCSGWGSCCLSTISGRDCSPSTCWACPRARWVSSSANPSPGTNWLRRAGTPIGRCTPGVTMRMPSCCWSHSYRGRESWSDRCPPHPWFSTVSICLSTSSPVRRKDNYYISSNYNGGLA